MKKGSQRDYLFYVIIAVLFTVYAVVFIYKTSFVIRGERYFSLFDDAMISMRYADNFVHGYGLVMNPGELVEGYTNPLWVLYMSPDHLFPISQSKLSLVIQITGALLLILNLFLVMRIARLILGESEAVSRGAVVLTAFYLPLINWSLQGMEVGLVTLIMSWAVLSALRALKDGAFSPWFYCVLSAATLVRIDMAVPYLGLWLALVILHPLKRRTHILWGFGFFIVFFGAQTLFRMLYYDDILPNTYYLKMTGYPLLLRITRGFIVFLQFIWRMNPVLFVWPFIMFLLSRERAQGLLLWVFGIQCLYSIYVGGDAWEAWGGSNRYIASVMPLLFVLVSLSLFTIARWLISQFYSSRERASRAAGTWITLLFSGLLVMSLFFFNNNRGPLSLGAFVFRVLPPNVEGNREMVEYAQIVRDITTPEAKVAVTWAGALPYFSGRYTVDILGKTDKVIAREKMRQATGIRRFTFFYPGHLKFNYAYSIGQLKPDIIIQFWSNVEEAEPYVQGAYVRLVVGKRVFFLRAGSEAILWDKISSGG